MTRPYSMDLRERVVALVDGGQSRRSKARLFRLGEATVIRWAKRHIISGSVAARMMGGPRHDVLRTLAAAGLAAASRARCPPLRQPAPATTPTLVVDGFEGPLDWLPHLVRTGRIDLAQLPIAALVDAFAKALVASLETHEVQAMLLGVGAIG